jgi:thioredoxin reductase (NADPH)
VTAPRCDLVIVGCGPAGIAASIWADDLHITAVTVESGPETGGQLHRVYNAVANYPGLSAPDGKDLARQLDASLGSRAVDLRLRSTASAIDVNARTVAVDGGAIETRFVLLATGVRPRRLDVPGAEVFAGRGVHGSATQVAEEYKGARVVVVGGGDAALEEALILAKVCEEVTIVHRGDTFSGRRDFRERVDTTSRIISYMKSHLIAIEGRDKVERVSVATPDGDLTLTTDAVFPCLGVEPNVELVHGLVALDERGYIKTDERQRASIDWIYAAGDVSSHSSLTIAAAVGQGAAAVKDISRRLVANE